jgi:hypothetical protein
MHRFECEHGIQFVDLQEIVFIQTPEKVNGHPVDTWCRCWLRGQDNGCTLPVSAEELHALVKAAKEPNAVPYHSCDPVFMQPKITPRPPQSNTGFCERRV